MLEKVNQKRSENCYCGNEFYGSVEPVSWNALLETSASKYASQLKTYRFFSHKGRDGTTIGQRATKVGYNWALIGENLGVGHRKLDEVIEAWMNSPSHCALIMNPEFTDIGAAKRGEYWVQHFGRKKNYKE